MTPSTTQRLAVSALIEYLRHEVKTGGIPAYLVLDKLMFEVERAGLSVMGKHPAAFINAIAEEGTKAEAIEFLQQTWDELCDARAALAQERESCAKVADKVAADAEEQIKHNDEYCAREGFGPDTEANRLCRSKKYNASEIAAAIRARAGE